MTKLLTLTLTATVVFACTADYGIWIPRSKSADALYRFVKNGKAGYIDHTGRVVIRPKFESDGNYGAEFHDGLLQIADGRYVNRNGKVVIDKRLYHGWDFSEGLAGAMRKESLWGYIDTSGKFVINPRFASSPDDYVYPFSDGLAMIKVKGRFGYIDRSGEFVIKPQFLDGSSFVDGIARVVTEGPCIYLPDGACASPRVPGGIRGKWDYPPCKFTYIDKTGRVITEARFDYARDFSEGLAPVRIGTRWGFIDKTGTIVIEPKFEDAEPFSSGLARIRVGELYSYADKSGSIKITPRYMYAEDFSEGFAVVSHNADRYFYIDAKGNRTIPGEFDAASPFFKGLAQIRFLPEDAAEARAEFAYIDTKGRRVFKY